MSVGKKKLAPGPANSAAGTVSKKFFLEISQNKIFEI